MSDRILTLFGEELKPEQPIVPGKNRAKKKPDDKKEQNAEELASQHEPTSNVSLFGPALTELPLPETELQERIVNSQNESAYLQNNAEPSLLNISPNEESNSVETGNEHVTINDVDAAVETGEDKPAKRKKEKPGEIPNLPADWNGEKQYYTIGEVADLFKVNTSHIRFWTNEFSLKVRTTRKGDRLYTPAQIKEIRAIHHLVKERGFTLAGAKAKLKQHANTEIEAVGLKQSLIMLRGKLLAIRTQLK